MRSSVILTLRDALDRAFPEQRLYLRSERNETRFIRLSPLTQLMAWTGTSAFVAWSIIATAFILMDSIGSGNVREQAKREQALYEMRLNELSTERDARADEALMAQERFNAALEQISRMQVTLLNSEDRRKEMEKGIEVIQTTLRRTMKERDAARDNAEVLTAQLAGEGGEGGTAADPDTEVAVDFLTAALTSTAVERDALAVMNDQAEERLAAMELERKLEDERNDRIFEQLEDAVSLSMEPLDKMFAAAGLKTDDLIDSVRRGYSGVGGPLTPMTFSTSGGEQPDATGLRANAILQRLDEMNLYRIAAEKAPFAMPLKSSFRYTSGFGPRWGRVHEGTDMAGSHGSPILATADGVVTFAGRQSAYGLLVKIKHDFGFETRYAHQSKIHVKVGQRVSRGDHIGDMGNTGRSTGTHLHYEVRLGGQPVNAMTYIKAAKDVF